mmetsp:Transcript_1918/g.5088  ORF Transcript_1918/g.5088 Transcript_1918/m.5088 type:complete len:250 (-) Transcript_1918:506-1255(-)
MSNKQGRITNSNSSNNINNSIQNGIADSSLVKWLRSSSLNRNRGSSNTINDNDIDDEEIVPLFPSHDNKDQGVTRSTGASNNNNNNNGGNHDDYYYYYDSYSVLPWTDYVLSVAIAVVETIVFARLLLKPLLADRNEILARSVLDQCRLFAAAAEPGIGEQRRTKSGRSSLSSSSWFDRWFAGPQAAVAAIATGSTVDGNGDGDGEPGIVYVPGSEPETLLARDSSNNNNNNNKGGGGGGENGTGGANV